MAATRRRRARPDPDGAVTRIVLVRHGETHWHRDNRYAGVSDVELTPHGVQQARELASWARTAALDAIWASDLSRAADTAQACAALTGLDPVVDRRLRELDFGAAEGLTRDEMNTRFPDDVRAFLHDPVTHHLPGGEDPVRAARRFTDCLHDIADQYETGRVLVVAHSTVIRLALCALIGVELSRYRRLFPALGNCALTEVRLDSGDVALLELNTPTTWRTA
jgi:broad specificity phosphatase PhoE